MREGDSGRDKKVKRTDEQILVDERGVRERWAEYFKVAGCEA